MLRLDRIGHIIPCEPKKALERYSADAQPPQQMVVIATCDHADTAPQVTEVGERKDGHPSYTRAPGICVV